MFKFNFYRKCSIAVLIALLSACGLSNFSHRDTNPVVVDDPKNSSLWSGVFGTPEITTFSTTASRRMVIVRQEENKEGMFERTVCSEPSPDVGEAFASAVADAINVKAPIEGVPVELSNQYARAVTTQIASLIYRTQGLQLYRDAMHNLCVDRLNKWITTTGAKNPYSRESPEPPNSYEELRIHYFDKSVELIKNELEYIKDVGEVKASANVDIDKVLKSTTDLLEAAKPEPAPVIAK